VELRRPATSNFQRRADGEYVGSVGRRLDIGRGV